MFPVKKAEENKFILTAPSEFIPPSLSCCHFVPPVSSATASHCSGSWCEGQRRAGSMGGWCVSDVSCSPSTLPPGFTAAAGTAQLQGFFRA